MYFPKVSVIIPNYNHEQFLLQRIESILAQTYDNFEVIILDDCSTDSSKAIIEKYRFNSKVKQIVYNDSNTGSPFKQWEKGVELATGEWIWIAESDDYADPRFIEIMLTTFPEPQRFGLIYCDSHIVLNEEVINETFASKRKKHLNSTHWDCDYINNGIHEIENYLLPHGAINNTSAVLFKTDIFKEVNPFDIEFRFIGDKYSFVKVLAVSDIAYINNPLNYYRAAIDSKPKHTNDYFDYVYEQFLIFDWVHRYLKLDKHKFDFAFKLNTELSLLKISKERIRVFAELMKLNLLLCFKMLSFNVVRSFNKLF